MAKIKLEDDNFCFVCGQKNEFGLKLKFNLIQGKQIKCEFMPGKQHQGYTNIVHGGIIGLILDEAMVNLLWKTGIKAVTANFEMRLKRPARINKTLFFSAVVDKEEKGIIYTTSECKDEENRIIALGRAKCVRV